MQELVFVTGNDQKIHTAFRVLKRYGIKAIQTSVDFDEIQGEVEVAEWLKDRNETQ